MCQIELPRLFKCTHLHNFLIRLPAFLVIFFGNSIMSIPLKMILYVFIGSGPENGGLNQKCTLDFIKLEGGAILTHNLKTFELILSNPIRENMFHLPVKSSYIRIPNDQ